MFLLPRWFRDTTEFLYTMIKIINDERQSIRQHVTAEILVRNDPSIGKRSRPHPEEASRSFGKVNKPRSIPTTIAEPRVSLCSMPICVVLIRPSVVPRFPPIRPTSFHSTTASFSSSANSLASSANNATSVWFDLSFYLLHVFPPFNRYKTSLSVSLSLLLLLRISRPMSLSCSHLVSSRLSLSLITALTGTAKVPAESYGEAKDRLVNMRTV